MEMGLHICLEMIRTSTTIQSSLQLSLNSSLTVLSESFYLLVVYNLVKGIIAPIRLPDITESTSIHLGLSLGLPLLDNGEQPTDGA